MLGVAGIRIAIDDFGTGYSALSYLNEYPTDVIKLDKSLIRGSDNNESNRIIIQAVKSLALRNNFEIVAEGVETQGELEMLQTEGIAMVQGFLFSKPVSAEKILEFMLFPSTELRSTPARA